MNMEQFEMLMNMLQNVTDGALTIAILYMVFMVLTDFVLPVVISLGGFYLVWKIGGLIAQACTHEGYIKELRDITGIGCSGMLTTSEKDRLRRWVIRKKEQS